MWKRVLFVLLALLLVGSPAAADTAKRADGEATSGPLDIKAVSHGHHGTRLVHTLRMYEEWRNPDLRDDSSWIALLFDRRESSLDDDRYLRIDYSEERGLHARMTTFGTHGPGEFIGRVDVSRPTRRSVRVRFPKRFLGRAVKRYEWRAISSFEDAGTCRSNPDSASQGGCIDYAPGRHRPGIEHDLNG
ncbi:MAG: hypothetical protein M3N53_08120 [Actinomycetota bacterium]|nr:hypothetical protein [Actinomycetota bacterium]